MAATAWRTCTRYEHPPTIGVPSTSVGGRDAEVVRQTATAADRQTFDAVNISEMVRGPASRPQRASPTSR